MHCSQIAVEGCCHGDLDKIYATLQAMENAERRTIDLLICCGDFQVAIFCCGTAQSNYDESRRGMALCISALRQHRNFKQAPISVFDQNHMSEVHVY